MGYIHRDKFLRSFTKKGFAVEQGRKEITVYFAFKGKATRYRTHCSRGAHGKTISDQNIKNMANQLNLTKEEFMKFYDCPFKRNDYIRLQKEKRGSWETILYFQINRKNQKSNQKIKEVIGGNLIYLA